MLLVTHLEMLLEAFDISAQALVLVSQLGIEILLEVQVTLHVVHFAVPEVQFVSLLAIVLFHESNATGNILLLSVLRLEVIFKRLNPILQGLLVGVESGAK